MELTDGILKDFADAVNSNGLEQTSDSQHLYATVTRVVEDELVYVRLNGAELETPAKTLVEVGVNDLVMCTMRVHTLTIIGNVSYPALTRVGPVYMTLTAEGLLIGKLNSENQPIDGYIIVGTNGSSIYDINGNMLATFGSTAQVGMTTASHVTTTSSGVEIRNGSNKILADFTANGITLRDSTGTTIASFAPNVISIGQSTSATVSFCGGKANIALDSSTLKISGGNSVDAIGISNTYNNQYKSEIVCEAKNSSPRASMQLFNGNSVIASMVLSGNGANFTLPENKVLSENGNEVAKLNDIITFGTINFSGTIPAATALIAPGDKPSIIPSAKDISVTVSGIPTGYTLCGIRGVTCTNAGRVFIGRYRGVLSSGKILVTLLNISISNVDVSGTIYWFAIRTSAAKVAPEQTIVF